mmetsp:Transcript_24035/g.62704  ORF Transcript_24035/g.62704 Transcript_24035/m.62704 type:complete len:126 (+) Transcript_24035:1890-2267(+)
MFADAKDASAFLATFFDCGLAMSASAAAQAPASAVACVVRAASRRYRNISACPFEAMPRRLAANRVGLQVGVCGPGEFRAPSAMACSLRWLPPSVEKAQNTLRRLRDDCNAQDRRRKKPPRKIII